jgi:glycosyltransferase involved in cell wall biosynthesis
MTVVISHSVLNANVRHAVIALSEAGLLHSLHTTINTTAIASRLPDGRIRRQLERRSLPVNLHGPVIGHPVPEILRLAARSLPEQLVTSAWKRRHSIDAVSRAVDRAAATSLGGSQVTGVYAYEDGALEQFKRARSLGLATVYDLPIGYWREHKRIIEEETLRRPEWSGTMNILRDSPEKLRRKDAELSLADAVVVASSYTRSTLNSHPSPSLLDRATVIPYGFPPVLPRGRERQASDLLRIRSTGTLRVLFIGALSQRKGLADVLDAAEQLRDRVELTIVGRLVESPNDVPPLARGLSRHRWIPSLPHEAILEAMRLTDVLLFPSLFEGFGLVLSEGMSQGAAVLATDRTAAPDLFGDGSAGRLVSASTPMEIVQVLDDWLSHPHKVIAIQAAAQERAQTRPWAAYQSELVAQVIRTLTAERT